jgi:phosphoribosylamine--glycine ligase
MMKILLIGSGGREHTIATTLIKYQNVHLFALPGNPGISRIAQIVALNAKNHQEISNFCLDNSIDLVVIGPEQPIADGLSDVLRSDGINVFAPSRSAAQLETSKLFAKQFMEKYNIPTARFRAFDKSQKQAASDYILNSDLPVVIKADGLAAGKGVIVATTTGEALQAIEEMFGGSFGSAGEKIVVEEFMQGEEASIFAITDGSNFVTLAPAQDHKRILDGDKGKNTGGMGAYCPAPIVTPEVLEKVKSQIIEPTLKGMIEEGHPYVGCLYVGLMINEGNPKVVEYNCRFGDPETQAVLSVFDGDFAELLFSAAKGELNASAIREISRGYATCVVLASKGYPDKYETGFEITGLDEITDNVIVYHAGTKEIDGKIHTNGGRVLGVTALGASLKESQTNAYKAVDIIHFENKYFRRDIAAKGIKYSS